MFDLWRSSFTLITYTAGGTSEDGVKYTKSATSKTIACWWTTGSDQRLLLKAEQAVIGQYRQGDATALMKSPSVDFNSILKLDYAITKDGLTYRIIDVNTRPRGFVYITLKKVEA